MPLYDIFILDKCNMLFEINWFGVTDASTCTHTHIHSIYTRIYHRSFPLYIKWQAAGPVLNKFYWQFYRDTIYAN